jgi:hypothetical protein
MTTKTGLSSPRAGFKLTTYDQKRSRSFGQVGEKNESKDWASKILPSKSINNVTHIKLWLIIRCCQLSFIKCKECGILLGQFKFAVEI